MRTVTVTQLVLNFAEACRALVPSLDGANVPWRDGNQYDNWDRVAEALFATLVTEPCAFQAVGEVGLGQLRIARYGFAAAHDYNAWVALRNDHAARVISLSSVTKPFDHIQCEEPIGLIPLNESPVIFVYERDGRTHSLEGVDLGAE